MVVVVAGSSGGLRRNMSLLVDLEQRGKEKKKGRKKNLNEIVKKKNNEC